ncbi:MAG: TRAP transporter substrate-binding protein [Deltaproteobacteria bacterium]|nr:TRAP transporter substrate-binding protein [Deltaproteobacteria bacterium]MBW1961195.1 TRAP transporter substrate-binding protein [Deltaproteobacteria bacterium]MBW1994485.1 TRAP transporter substrate-binding protein [Deltaproteobacteria bacterium]MBW2152480.1 TRAP transporter substrate-binding protein [Deltaproteobacteria bacterium]
MRKKITLLGTCFLVMAVLMLMPGQDAVAKAKYEIKLACHLTSDHPHPRTFEFFAKKVKEYTDSQVEIKVFPAGQLGRTDDVIMGLQMGTLQMGKAALSFATKFIPEVKIFDLPYLFANRRHLNRVLDGPLGEHILNEVFPKYGLIGLFYQDDGARSVYCMEPVRKPADLKGKKIRVMTSDVMIDAINAMGGVATPMAWPEVYTGLEQKTIDGAENSPVLLYTSKHWEVSKVYSMTEQFWLVSALFASKKYWDTLPADIQQQIRRAADVAKWYCRYIYLEDENVAFDKLQSVGVKIVRDVDVAAFKAAVQPVWQRYVKKYPYAADWIKQIQATPAD